MAEAELVAALEGLAAKNTPATRALSFLGAGAYDYYAPAVANAIRGRRERRGETVGAVAQARPGTNVLGRGSFLERRPYASLASGLARLLGEPWQGEGLGGADCAVDPDALWDDVTSYLAAAIEAVVRRAVLRAEVSIA